MGKDYRYPQAYAGIVLFAAISLINPQTISGKTGPVFKTNDVPFYEKPWEGYLAKAYGTGGSIFGNRLAENVKKTESIYWDEVESPIMHAKSEYKITLKIKSIIKGRPFSKYELEG